MASSPTLLAGQDLTADTVGIPAWIPMSSLLVNSWVNTGAGFTAAQYRLWKLYNSVEVIGAISSGTITDGTIIATLPAGYLPVTSQEIAVKIRNTSGGATGNSPVIQVNSSAQLQVFHLPTGTTDIFFHEFYSLDA